MSRILEGLYEGIESTIKNLIPNAKRWNFSYKPIPSFEEYTIGLTDMSHELEVWSHDGGLSIGSTEEFDWRTDESVIPNMVEWIMGRILDNENDIIYCSDCGKKMPKSEIAGHYFAGSYCKDCWEGYWKEKESKEDYN